MGGGCGGGKRSGIKMRKKNEGEKKGKRSKKALGGKAPSLLTENEALPGISSC